MTLDEKLTRLQQEMDSLASAIGLSLEAKKVAGNQASNLHIPARFESCEVVLKSLNRDIANKDKDDPIRASVLSLREGLSALLDKYEAQDGR